MSLWGDFWADDRGAIISAELAAVATVAVVGTTVGLSTWSKSVNEELKEIAVSIRSLNQSYSVPGHASCRAWTAGSSYTQPDVNQSVQDLIGDTTEVEKEKSVQREGLKKRRDKQKGQPKTDSKKNDESKGEEQKIPQKKVVGELEQATLPQQTDEAVQTEDLDDESQVETVIVPQTDA